jgi:hypothetical protein
MSTFTHSHRHGFRALCWLMAALMFAAPSLPALAQEPAPLELTYLLPQACVVVAARPRQLLTAPAAAMLPIEVVQAAALQQTGLDPLEAETLLLSVEPPQAGPPNYALLATFTRSVEGKLHPQLTAHTQPGQLDGREYFQSQHPLMPSIFSFDGKTLLATPDMTLQKLVATETSPTGNLLAERLKAAATDDLYAAVNIETLRPMANQLLREASVLPQFQPFLPAPDLIRLVELRVNLSGLGPTELVVEANNANDAGKLLAMLEQAMDMWRTAAMAEMEELKQSSDPVQQALGRYQQRMMNQTSGLVMPQQEGARLIVFRVLPGESPTSPLVTGAIIGILVALLLPAVQAAREAARRNASINNMKHIMLSILNYEDRNKHFPTHANYDATGKPLLSWRVHILPYLDQQQLYNQFHLDEPWDSEHNRQLVAKMPEVFLDPSSRFAPEEGKTHYLGVLGEGCFFSGTSDGTKIMDITDGTSNSIAVVQVNDERATPWTKPDDWQYDQKNPLAGLVRSLHPGVFFAARCDGSVFAVDEDVAPEQFKRMLTIAAGD